MAVSLSRMKGPWLGYALPPALAVLLLWLPFGFSLHALIEEWGVLEIFQTHGPVWFVKLNSVLEAHRIRPLTVFPHALGYVLDPDSFDGWHWVLIVSLIMKGAAASYLGAVATRSVRWGVFFGLLVLLYPADTMQLSFRSQHINASMAVLLLGSAVLVAAQRLRPGWMRGLRVVLAGLCILAAALMYEVALAMVAIPLFVLWCRDGTAPTWRSVRADPVPTLGWIIPAAVYVAYALYAARSGGALYQQGISDQSSPLTLFLHLLPKLFSVGITRGLVGGWYDAWLIALTEFRSHAYLLGFGALCSACVAVLPAGRGDAPAEQTVSRALLRLAAAGLVLLVFGYVLFLFSNAHVLITQRTFLFAAFGAALVVLAMVMGLARLWKPLAIAAVPVLLTTGAAAQLYQFQHYVRISELQRQLLRSVVENFDGTVRGRKTLVLLDQSNRLSHTWMLVDYAGLALTYLYDRPGASTEICLMPVGEWQRRDALQRSGRCIEGAQNWAFKAPESLPGMGPAPYGDVEYPKSEVVPLVIRQDGGVASDASLDTYRRQLQTADTPAARRYRNILIPSQPPLALDLFKSVQGGTSYRWDFGKWWSLDEPIRGAGWGDASWSGRWLRHDASTWKTQPASRLLFELEPTDRPYTLVGQWKSIETAAIRNSMRVKINGIETALQWAPAQRFSAAIPPGALQKGTNVVEFDAVVDGIRDTAATQLTFVELRPAD